MTSPGGGSANLGTVTGKVRIEYESSNVAKAVKDVTNFQNTLADVGSSAVQSAKEFDRASGSLSQFGVAASKLASKPVANPAEGLGKRVENETGRATKALSSLQHAASRGGVVKGRIKVSPTKVEIDNVAVDRALRNGSLTSAIRLNAVVRIAPSEVILDQKAIDSAVRSKRIDPITLRVPVRLDPSDVTLNNAAVSKAVGSVQSQRQSTASTAGMAGMVPLLAKVTAGAGAAAVGIGAVGAVFAKGFSRLNSLDAATVKLAALGKSAQEIQVIAKGSLEAVEGTAFGLEEAFATAASAINAGIAPGANLDKYLKATANTAALAGISMEELGIQFSRAATNGRLTGEILQSLNSNQVPVLKLLAEEYGVTQRKAHEMVVNQEVDFDTFINAMSKTGGAAKAMGNTISGSFKNLGAAVSRLGAAFLAPLFGKENADDASVIAAAVQKVTDGISSLGKSVKEHQSEIVTFWEVLGKGGLVVAKTFTTLVSFISDAVIKITEVIGDTTGWLSDAFAAVADFVGADGVAANVRDFADSMHDLGTGLRETRDINMAKMNQGLDSGWASLTKWAQAGRNAANGGKDFGDMVEDTTPKVVELTDALDALSIKGEAAETALTGTNAQFNEFIDLVKDKGGTDALIKTLTEVRRQFENGGRQVKEFADAIESFGDKSQDAGSRADALLDSLRGLDLLPGGSALAEYNEELDKMTSYTSTLIDRIDTMGDSLANADGTLDLNSQNGRNLLEQIESTRRAMVTLIASGEAGPEEAYARTVEGLNQLLQGQAGISADVAQRIIDTYLPKGTILNSIKAQDPKEALESIFNKDPAKLESVLKLLTTSDDVLKQIVGPDGQLHIPTVLDTTGIPGSAGGPPKPGQPGFIGPVAGPLRPVAPPGVPVTPTNLIPTLTDGTGAPPYHPLAGPLQGTTLTEKNLHDLVALTENKEALQKALAENADINAPLEAMVQQAEAQGENLSVALARGIVEGDENVKQALVKLAELAGDYLGNSPAKYGPLSGKGWTLYRGKVFSQDWAQGIESAAGEVAGAVSNTASAAVSGMSGSGFTAGGGTPIDAHITTMIKDLQELSDLGKLFLNFGNQVADIAFGVADLANTLSNGRLFPRSYVKDPNAARGGSPLAPWHPTQNPRFQPGIDGGFQSTGSSVPGNSKGDAVAGEFVRQATAAGWNQEQILAGLGVLNQETAYGTNPRTNDVQNQNGTPGITGIFQQDLSYRKYGDPRDVNNAIRGFIDQFGTTGDGLSDPNPWRQALDVQRPARVGSGGYDDRGTNDPGGYLRDRQRQQALETFNRVSGAVPGPITVPSTTTGAIPQRPIGAAPAGQTWDYTAGQWVPAPGAGDLGISVNRPRTPRTPGVTATPGGLLAGLDLTGAGVNLAGAHGQIALVAAIAKTFGLEMTSGATNHEQDGGFHPRGQAGDFSNSQGNSPQQAAFASFMAKNFGPMLQELIYSDPNAPGVLRGGGKDVTGGTYYDAQTLSEHLNHVHLAIRDEMAAQFTQAVSQAAGIDVSSLVASASAGQSGTGTGPLGPLTSPLNSLVTNTNGLPSMPGQLQELVAGDEVLRTAMQNQAGLTSESVVPVLQHLDGLIAEQTALGTPKSQGLAKGLGDYKAGLQSQFGLSEGPTGLETAQTLASGISSIANDIFGLFDQGIKTIGATHDITTVLTRGIADTGDVNRLVDDAQEFITMFQQIWQTASDISGFAASIAAIGAADPSGGGAAAAGALEAVSAVTGLIAQGLAAVNAAIDIAQEAYAITTKYIGRFILSWTGLSGASDVKYLLDEYTGQVAAYTSENPNDKKLFDTPGKFLESQRYAGAARAAPINHLTIYQGPGQDPRDTMNDAMFAIRSSSVGAYGYAI